MQLIDLMNRAINKHDVTFLCLIHENPGSVDKARGHLGTEIMNKASTVIQVSFEKGKNGEPTDLVRVKYLKCRNSKKHQPFYIEYNTQEKGLVVADETTVSEVAQSRKLKAELSEIKEHLQLYLTDPMSNKDLLEELTNEFDCNSKTIRQRLKDLIENHHEISNSSGNSCYLKKDKQGKEIIYSLVPNNELAVEESRLA